MISKPCTNNAGVTSLDDTVGCLSGVGPKRLELLAALGVQTVRDLLFHLPRDYQDRRSFTAIGAVSEGDTVTVEAEVVRSRMVRMRGRMTLAVVTFRDDTGEINATWFGRGFLAKAFTPGAKVLLSGTVGKYKGLALKNPDYELLTGEEEDQLNTGRIVPVYRLTEKVTQRMLRRWVRTALDAVADDVPETLPESLRTEYEFPPMADALRAVHFPETLDAVAPARKRFVYEELLGIQLGVLRSRAHRRNQEAGVSHRIDGPAAQGLAAALPFTLTAAQSRAIDDLFEDMRAQRPMARLIQGDVGCGKTAVALHAIAAAADGGFQTALMAPTELLAEQHAATVHAMLEPLGVRVCLLTGSTRAAAETRKRIAAGEADVVVGTHALIQDATQFHRLGLVVVDEQHRFGVLQRTALTQKGVHPDTLHMTATPIPRTLALTVYGAMDITVIDELPPGRRPVVTRRVAPGEVDDVHAHVLAQAARGFQSYVICPLVEQREGKELRDAVGHFEELSSGVFASLNTALVHGRLDAGEKDRIMRAFSAGTVDVLFSTTVVEVGIDVSNATTMLIEDAAQFGLTQLHQLRGRVARANEQAHCFLLGKPKTDEGARRLAVMCETSDGFEIAEEDLKLRGPGEFFGVRQAGLSDLRAADLVRDARVLDQARRDAQRILKEDPALESPCWAHLGALAREYERITA